jgi:hypothetical protein
MACPSGAAKAEKLLSNRITNSDKALFVIFRINSIILSDTGEYD